jgi:uncharacterized protein Smg (DUF494 family)
MVPAIFKIVAQEKNITLTMTMVQTLHKLYAYVLAPYINNAKSVAVRIYTCKESNLR